VGILMGVNWRPRFDPTVVRRELDLVVVRC